jgi:hypothetical protein
MRLISAIGAQQRLRASRVLGDCDTSVNGARAIAGTCSPLPTVKEQNVHSLTVDAYLCAAAGESL